MRILQKIFCTISFCLPVLLAAQEGTLPPEAWQRDLVFLQKELPQRVPFLFQKLKKGAWDGAFAALSANLSGKTEFQMALDLQKTLAQVGDPHLKLDLTQVLQRQMAIPVGFSWYPDGFYVSATVKRFEKLLGQRIVAINGLPPETALQRLSPWIAADNEHGLRKEALSLLRFPELLRQSGIGQTDTLDLLADAGPGQKLLFRVFPLDPRREGKAMTPVQFSPENPDFRWQAITALWSKDWLPEEGILYVRYNRALSREMSLAAGDSAMAVQLPEFQPFANAIALHCQQFPGKKLVLDLRFNPGGQVSDGLMLAEMVAGLKESKAVEQVFVFTNAYTTGAAVQIAHFFRETAGATLVGSPTGAKLNQSWDFHSVLLPNSGLKVAYGSKWLEISPDAAPSLVPDVSVELKFADFKNGRDPLLDYVRGLKN